MAAIPSYRAEMVGLSERDRTLLRSFLAASQARTGIRWDGGASQAAVHFIDIDGQAGAEFWQSLPENERRDAAIVISSAPPSEAARWLPKPLRSASLLGVLEQMTLPARAPATPAAAAPAPPASAPSASKTRGARTRDPNEPLRLLDVLEDGAATGARAVQSTHWPDIVLGSGNTHAMRTAPLEEYVEGFAASTDVTRVAKYTGGPLDDELRIDLDTLRWLALLHAPLGEIVRRLPRPERVRLRALPPFGQLPHTLQQVRMAAWLVQHPASPQEVAEMVGADEETVLRFLAACDVLELVQEVGDAAAAAMSPAAAPAAATPAVAAAPLVASPPAVPLAPAPLAAVPFAAPAAPAPVPDAVIAAIDGATQIEVEAPPVTEVTAEAAPVAETMSVLERLRATREQNRARVAAAIRNVSGN